MIYPFITSEPSSGCKLYSDTVLHTHFLRKSLISRSCTSQISVLNPLRSKPWNQPLKLKMTSLKVKVTSKNISSIKEISENTFLECRKLVICSVILRWRPSISASTSVNMTHPQFFFFFVIMVCIQQVFSTTGPRTITNPGNLSIERRPDRFASCFKSDFYQANCILMSFSTESNRTFTFREFESVNRSYLYLTGCFLGKRTLFCNTFLYNRYNYHIVIFYGLFGC